MPAQPSKPRPAPGPPVAGRVAELAALLRRHAWSVEWSTYRDARGKTRWVAEASWVPSAREIRVDRANRAEALAAVAARAGKLGLLGPESRPPGFKPPRPRRRPRMISFTDLGYDPS